jgi:hypothetical protein
MTFSSLVVRWKSLNRSVLNSSHGCIPSSRLLHVPGYGERYVHLDSDQGCSFRLRAVPATPFRQVCLITWADGDEDDETALSAGTAACGV